LSVPIFVPETIDVKDKDTFEVCCGFFGPKGNQFGETVTLKVKVNEGAKEL